MWDVGRTCGKSLDHVAGQQNVSKAGKPRQSREKRGVVKVTRHLATGRHVTLPFNLQAVSGIFQPCLT